MSSSPAGRPSIFAKKAAGDSLSIDDTIDLFLADVRAGGMVTGPPPARPPDISCRVVQWNINALRGPHTDHSIENADEAAALLLDLSPDIIVLQECGSRPEDVLCSKIAYRQINELATCMRSKGYELFVANAQFPTAVATRLPILSEAESLELDGDESHLRVGDDSRAALRARVGTPDGKSLLVYGTHLHHRDVREGGIRRIEAENLLKSHDALGLPDPVLVVADFNQQRQCDYLADEWAIITAGKAERGEPDDDGVASCFTAAGFACSLDMEGKDCNWPSALPPPTHWSGTNIDYAFAKGVQCCGVYVIETCLSDHLPVVTDWKL